jgi:hypothetical protein
MRTTVTLDPDVEALLKTAMLERDASFRQVLNDAVRAGLKPPGSGAARRQFELRTFNMGPPLVDLTKANALADELGDQDLIARMNRPD